MLQQDMKGLQASHADVSKRVEVQRVALTKTQADLKNTDSHVDVANENLAHLKNGLANIDMTVSKLGSHYNNCSKSLQGVSRGLADVSKHVSHGEHGMLAPKLPQSQDGPHMHVSFTGEVGLPPRSPRMNLTRPLQGGDHGLFTPRSPPGHGRRLPSLSVNNASHLDSQLPIAR
mmetsp:Transcript_32001/g.95334  ORF Transcript_32001/g.95334 Transcript_32001/m.95334 type:complete len:174 (-) Transcript_32001:498-1019(-)